MNILLLLSGVILANKEPNKTYLETITGIKAVEQGKIPVIAKKVTSKANKALKNKKTVQKKKVIKKKAKKVVKKTSQKKKKVKSAKKKVVKKKATKTTKYNYRYNVGEIQSYAHSLVLSYGWSEQDYQYLVLLWNRESSWNPNAVNKKSGACGIPQSLPCSKMASEGSDYRTNYKTQVRWGLKYIANRYGSPTNAWKHSQRTGWY